MTEPAGALLFDLDGTLSDPREGIVNSILHALAGLQRAAPPADALTRYIGPPLREGFAELLASDDTALIERAIALYRERFAVLGLYENVVYPGVAPLLEALHRQGRALYVVTSKPTVYAERIVAHFGLDGYFRHVYGSGLDGTRGDKAELIGYVLERESLAPEAALMIGDREHDALGAARNRVASVGVLWGYGSAGELRRAGAGRLCATPAELAALLGARAARPPAAP